MPQSKIPMPRRPRKPNPCQFRRPSRWVREAVENRAPDALLEMLRSRWDSEIKYMPDRYRQPIQAPDKIERGARLHAEANKSDPYAYGRMKLHLTRGLDSVSAIVQSSMQRINALRLVSLG